MRYNDENSLADKAKGIFSTLASKKNLAIGASALALLVGVSSSVYTVPETYRGLVYEWNKLATSDTSELKKPGLHFKVPVWQSVKMMPVGQQTINLEKENIYTKDSQDLDAAIQITYNLPETKLVDIARNNPNYDSVLIQTVRQALKDSFGRTEATDIPSTRNTLMQASTENARKLVDAQLGIHVQNVTMPNFEYSPAFKQSIVRASQMKADAERARQEVEKDKAQADSAREIAKGKADAAIQAARGEAEAINLRATAEAKRLDLEGAALARNPGIKELRLIEKWNGEVPQVLTSGGAGSGAAPFLSLFPTGMQAKAAAPAPAH